MKRMWAASTLTRWSKSVRDSTQSQPVPRTISWLLESLTQLLLRAILIRLDEQPIWLSLRNKARVWLIWKRRQLWSVPVSSVVSIKKEALQFKRRLVRKKLKKVRRNSGASRKVHLHLSQRPTSKVRAGFCNRARQGQAVPAHSSHLLASSRNKESYNCPISTSASLRCQAPWICHLSSKMLVSKS